jgi:hypothetical protein
MALKTGLNAQVGFVAETTYGTGVTPTRFVEFTSESINKNQTRIESSGIRAGKFVQRIDRWSNSTVGAAGDVSFEISTQGFGLLFKWMLGTSTQTADGTGFKHSYTWGDLDGLAFTTQVGRPSTAAGVVQPFTYTGCKVTSWTLSQALTDQLMLSLSLDAQNETTATALATASYSASNDFILSYQQGAATVGGSSVSISQFSLTGNNNLKTDRLFIGATTTKKEPVRNAFLDITGQMTLEFEDLTQYNRFTGAVPGTAVAITATWDTGITYDTGKNYRLILTMPNCRIDGSTPNVANQDMLTYTLPFRVMTDAANSVSPVTLDYYNNTTGD